MAARRCRVRGPAALCPQHRGTGQATEEEGPALRDEGFLHELMDRDDAGLWRLVMDRHPELITTLCLTDIWSGSHPLGQPLAQAERAGKAEVAALLREHLDGKGKR